MWPPPFRLAHSGHFAAGTSVRPSDGRYAAAFSVYHYLTFLGYSELPFLRRCECFIYPVAAVMFV